MLEITIKNMAANDLDIQKIIEERFDKNDRLDITIMIDKLPKDEISVNDVNMGEGDTDGEKSEKVSKAGKAE